MSKNPFINAVAAACYIIIVASVMFYGTRNLPKEDTIITPIAILSLFTFSVAMMGYFFIFQPLQLYLDGKKKQAVNLFVQTIGVFGGIKALLLVLLFMGVFHT
jgi:hypothetical protein